MIPTNAEYRNIKHEFISLTPELAQKWLDDAKKSGAKQRPISQAVIDKYTENMKNGLWDGLNGESFKFDTDNIMIDGQHRCLAVIKSGVTITILITRGISRNAFFTLDSGKSRTRGDVLGIYSGFTGKKPATLAAVVCLLVHYDSKTESWITATSGKSKFTNREMIEAYNNQNMGELLSDLYDEVYPMVKEKLMTITSLVICEYLLTQIAGRDKAREFLSSIIKGNVSDNTPIWQAREFLRKFRSQSRADWRVKTAVECNTVATAWNRRCSSWKTTRPFGSLVSGNINTIVRFNDD